MSSAALNAADAGSSRRSRPQPWPGPALWWSPRAQVYRGSRGLRPYHRCQFDAHMHRLLTNEPSSQRRGDTVKGPGPGGVSTVTAVSEHWFGGTRHIRYDHRLPVGQSEDEAVVSPRAASPADRLRCAQEHPRRYFSGSTCQHKPVDEVIESRRHRIKKRSYQQAFSARRLGPKRGSARQLAIRQT